MDELLRVIKYIESCRDRNIDCTITIDKSKTLLILNALNKHVKRDAIGDNKCPECGTEVKECNYCSYC